MQDGEADLTMGANCGGLTRHYVAMSKVSVANAKAGQGLLMMVSVARRLPWTNVWSQLTVYCRNRGSKGTSGFLGLGSYDVMGSDSHISLQT